MAELLVDPWSYAFMRRALLEVVLIALACGPVGALLMLRRLAYAGESLGHALVPGVALALAAGVGAFGGALAGAIVAALAIAWMVARAPGREDAVVALAFSVALAGGVVILAVAVPPQRATAVLFGDLLAVDRRDVVLGAIVAVALTVLLVGAWRSIAVAAFDPTWSRSAGLRIGILDGVLLLAAAIALVITLQGLGALLGLALLLAPAATLRPWIDRVTPLLLLTAPLGAVAGVIGLLLSYHQGIAAGPAVATVLFVAFLVSRAIAAGAARRPATT